MVQVYFLDELYQLENGKIKLFFSKYRLAIRYIRHLQAILDYGPDYETKLFTVQYSTQQLPPMTSASYCTYQQYCNTTPLQPVVWEYSTNAMLQSFNL